MKTIGTLISFLLITSLLLCSCSQFVEQEKTFTVEDMKITLSDYFQQYSHQDYTVVFDSHDVAIFGLMYPYDMMDEESELSADSTLEEFGETLLESNENKDLELKQTDGLSYYFYDSTSETTQVSYSYLTVLYKSETAFWLMQFVCETEKYEKFEPALFQYAKSVTFASREAE